MSTYCAVCQEYDDEPMDRHACKGAMPVAIACPFCGSADKFVERGSLCDAQVVCNDCGARGPSSCQDSDDEETPGARAAIIAWNKRASDVPHP